MSNRRNRKNDLSQPRTYEIRIQGHLGSEWADWFEGMIITLEEDGHTLLTGPVIDQAALRSGGFSKWLSLPGLVVGAVGIVSIIPGLTDILVGVFGLSQMIWYVVLGVVLLRRNSVMTVEKPVVPAQAW